MSYWAAPRLWRGETAFILAGGPSVLSLDLSLLKGQRVIAINSAWKTWPSADVLFFADGRWYAQFRPTFNGMMVTTSDRGDAGLLRMRKSEPHRGLSTDRTRLAMRRTSVTAAINLAMHFACDRIVLLGVDGKLVEGVRHHHDDKYPWPLIATCWDDHAEEFAQIKPSIDSLGIKVLNGNPDSAIEVFPKVEFGSLFRAAA